jgi:hypothetical protein
MARNQIYISLLVFLFVLTLDGYFLEAHTGHPRNPSTPSEKTLPLIAMAPDGVAWVGWFDHRSGSYALHLQQLDKDDTPLFSEGGLVVSSHSQDEGLFGWDLIADSKNHAVLAFSDLRSGEKLTAHAYRVSPTGKKTWGKDGRLLSAEGRAALAPKVVETSDGDFVFVWNEHGALIDGRVRMQRLSAEGRTRFKSGGVVVAAQGGESPGMVDLVASGSSVILSWIRDLSYMHNKRHLWADRFSSSGKSVWGRPTIVYDAFSLPMGYAPRVLSTKSGGIAIVWHCSERLLYQSFVQQLDAWGRKLFNPAGQDLSSDSTHHHMSPVFTLDSFDRMLVAWSLQNEPQSQQGVWLQKIDSLGNKMLSGRGIDLVSSAKDSHSPPEIATQARHSVVLFVQTKGGYDHLWTLGINQEGEILWMRRLSNKTHGSVGRYQIAMDREGRSLVVWEDDRLGDRGLAFRRVEMDGTLGPIHSL